MTVGLSLFFSPNYPLNIQLVHKLLIFFTFFPSMFYKADIIFSLVLITKGNNVI